MRTISSGEPNTLGTWLKIAKALTGDDSKAVSMLKQKIADSPKGENKEVIVAESHMMYLIVKMG